MTSSTCLGVMPCSVRVAVSMRGARRLKKDREAASTGVGENDDAGRVELGLNR